MQAPQGEIDLRLRALLSSADHDSLRPYLKELLPAEIGESLESLDNEQRKILLSLLEADRAAEVFGGLEERVQEEMTDLLSEKEIAELLEERFDREGFDAVDTAKRLESLFAVQNSYLSAFQSLGALGLLLGTFGLATVQLRNVLERRSELALMRAAGFRRASLALTVLLENALLLVLGLAIGVLAALVAVLPHLLAGGAGVPIRDLSVMLAVILTAGLAAGAIAAYRTLRAPLLPALRGE